jgi:pimeloyl-ACP methyl ester carboxylesterase
MHLGFGKHLTETAWSIPGDQGRAAERLFVDSIEAWRLRMRIGSLILCAHSFGAYIVTRYAPIRLALHVA